MQTISSVLIVALAVQRRTCVTEDGESRGRSSIRLATHYTYTAEKCTLLLENVILDYLDFFKTKGLPIHTARVEVTFLMSKLFHVPLTARSDIFTSEKNMFFSNVKPIPDSRSSSMQLPTGCRLTTTPDKEIQILCPFYPSGDIKYSSNCTIALHWPNTILSFNDFTVSLDIKLRLQSDRIYGLISLVGQLRTCKGVTIVNTGGDSKIEHAEKCERIILPLSRETCCKSCSKSCIHVKSLQERIANIEQVVEGGRISSVEPVGVAEDSCKPDNDKSRDTNIHFASHEELTAVSNSDTQDVFEDTEYYFDYSNVVEIGQINSLEHSGIVEDTCILAGDKSKDTEMDFASHDTLFKHDSVANRDTQHVFEDTEYSLGYSNVVEIGQMSSLDHSGTVEDTYILAGDKSKDTEMDFASHDTLFKHGSVANRDTQHVFVDAQDSLGYCYVELDDPEHFNEKGGVDLSITADNNDFSEPDGITPTNGLNIPATLENKLSTDVFDEDSQTKWLNQEQTNTDTMSDDFGVSRENSRTDMIEDRNNEKMTESEEGDTNMCNDIDEFETLKPRSDLLLLQSSTHTPEILKTLLRMQRENKYCDFKLVTPYKTINVHKLIILANSPSFMQNHGSLDNIEELHFPEVLPTVLDSVVYFLYTGKLKVKKSEISLLKSFCESEGLKSALELLKDYSDVETLNLTVEQLMESPNSHSKHIFEDELAKTPLHISGQKGKPVAYIMKELEAETEKECSVVTKSGRVSKPTSLKVATVLAEKKKTKVKSLISEIKSKEHMLMIQKSKSFRSNDTDSKGKSKAHMLKIQKCLSSKRTYLRRKLLSRHSVYIRHERRRPSIKNNNKKDSEVTDNQNIYSNLIEKQNSSEQNPMEQSEEFDPYLFHSYALSIADTSDNDDGDDNNTDYNDNDDDDDAENDDQYECEIDGENEINGERNPKEKDGKQQIKQKTKQKERVQYRCPECDKVMRCKRYILKHKAEVHRDKESIKAFKNTTCEICGKIVITFKELARHVINKHGNKDQKNIRLVRKETCRSCGLVLQHIADRIRHESRHHGLQNKSRLNVSVQCSHCEKKFAADLNLKFHEFHCHGIAPERNILSYCKVEGCNYVARDNFNLECHIKRRHNSGHNYSCEFCGKQYKAASDVDRHVTNVHTCKVCEKQIGTKQELKSHMNSDHTVEEIKPLQCDSCLQRFARKQGLDMHLYRHHDRPLPKGTTWHHCDKCSYVSAFRNLLEKHIQLHKGATVYTCEICQLVFSSQQGLKIHGKRIHKGVRAKRNPKLCEESAESDSETDASVEFHETDDDDDENKRSNKLSLEFDTDITELNETPAFSYELRQRKPRKYQQELECEFDEDTDDVEGN